MKRISLKKTSFFTAAFMLLSPAMGIADIGDVYVNGTNPTTIKVRSNGQAYTQIEPFGNLTIQARLNFDTGVVGTVKSWWAEPVMANGYGIATPVQGLGAYRQSKSYPAFSRPAFIGKNLVFSISSSNIRSGAVSMCNFQAGVLQGQGLSNEQIFGQDRYVKFDVWMVSSVDSTGAGSNYIQWQYRPAQALRVQCSKWQGTQIPTVGNDLMVPLQVNKATMQLKEIVTLGGTCKVATQTMIVTTQANAAIKYRFVHSGGKKSKVFTVKTKANKIAIVSRKWDVPNKPGIEQGWMQIVGVSPGFKSNKAQYSMRCKAKGPGGFAPNPKKPKVRIPLGGSGTLNN